MKKRKTPSKATGPVAAASACTTEGRITGHIARIKAGLARMVQQGGIAHTPVFGYACDARRRRGVHTSHTERAAVVRRIFDDLDDGLSPTEVARRLNEGRVPTPAECQRLDRGAAARATVADWTSAMVARLSANPIYMGVVVHGRNETLRDKDGAKAGVRLKPPEEWTIVRNPGLEIVDPSVWLRVRNRLARKVSR